MEQLWRISFESGAVMCLVCGGYLLLLLRIWPRVFLKRYPAAIQAAVAPLNLRERKLGFAVSIPLFLSLLAFPTWAGLRMAGQADPTFADIFLAAYIPWMIFNAFDWLVLDELVIGVARPQWLVLEGAEHLPLEFDHAVHAIAFVKGTIGGAVLATLIASVILALT